MQKGWAPEGSRRLPSFFGARARSSTMPIPSGDRAYLISVRCSTRAAAASRPRGRSPSHPTILRSATTLAIVGLDNFGTRLGVQWGTVGRLCPLTALDAKRA